MIHQLHATSETPAAPADVRLRQVALFKNGLGFFLSEVTIPAEQTFRIAPVATTAHGTFWVSYPAKVKVKSLVAKEVVSEKLVQAVSISELLRANVGQKARLYLGGRKERPVEGVIKYFPANREASPSQPYGTGGDGYAHTDIYYDESDQAQPAVQSHLVIVAMDKTEVAIDPQDVKRVEFFEDKARKTFARKTRSMQLDVQLAAPAAGQKLTVSYLAKGITWTPSYMVDITDSDKALISAKAAIINEICDLDGVKLLLVTGVPHLKFAEVASPLAQKQPLWRFLQSLILAESGQLKPAGVITQAIGYEDGYGGYGGYGAPAPIMPEYGAAKEGQVAEDLFLYPIEDVQLKKGQTVYCPLFTESVPCQHIYQWEIPDYVDEQGRYFYYDRRRGQEHKPAEEVWHCLRLENSTKVPWTTAPAETVKQGMILGQDTLKYTAIKAKTTLRITKAVNVKAEQSELEIAREREALRLYGDYFDLITVEGKLSVTNFQAKSITLEIIKTLSGEVKSSQPTAAIETLARGVRWMNPTRKLIWTVELKPAERKQLSYTYQVYVRR